MFVGMEFFLGMTNNISNCEDRVSASKALYEFTKTVYYANRAKWTSACPPPCKQKSYSVDVKKFHTNSWIEHDYQSFKDVSQSAVVFSLAYETFVVEEQVETLVYDAGNFLAAVGGNLGLFLGFSCLTMMLGIYKFVKKIKWPTFFRF